MIIEGNFYRLTPIDDRCFRFDLELLYDIGGKNPRKEFKNAGYGMSLPNCVKSIAAHAVYKKYDKDEIISLKQYLKDVEEIYEEIKKEISEAL
jgi:hypothetical protein